MDDLQKHRKEFEKIVQKYNLFKEDKADEIAKFLTNNANKKVDANEFATLFNMKEDETRLFLSFIQKGIEFKEKHLDKNK